jgi:hypothetical protein
MSCSTSRPLVRLIFTGNENKKTGANFLAPVHLFDLKRQNQSGRQEGSMVHPISPLPYE